MTGNIHSGGPFKHQGTGKLSGPGKEGKGSAASEAIQEQAHHGAKRGEGTAVNPDAIFEGLNKSGSAAQLGVLAQRLEANFKNNFPSLQKFNELVKGFSHEELNHPVFASIISQQMADKLTGKVEVVAS